MPALDPTLTPYDTGEVCEPKLWQPDRDSVLWAMHHEDELKDIGKVDFEDDSGETVVMVRVTKASDGPYTLHVIPFVDAANLVIERHDEPIV